MERLLSALPTPERDWQATVVEAAERLGWRVYHTYDARRSHPGFPDLVLVRPPRLRVCELKGDRGRLTPEQRAWLADLTACGVEVAVWRPADDWDAIVAALR